MTRWPRKRRRSCMTSGLPEIVIVTMGLLAQVNAILYDWLGGHGGPPTVR
jgi:hypothetical protein